MQRGLLLLLLLPHAVCLVLPGPLRQLYYDWVALNARSTTRHIMKPLTTAGREELLLLKQQVRAEVTAGSFVVDAALMAKAKQTMIVMHPLPRVGEIAEEVDADPRAVRFANLLNQ